MVYFAHIYIGLLIAILVLAIAAKKLQIPYPIACVVGGLLISFFPGLPQVALPSDLIFLLILPPILFSSGYLLPFPLFKKNLTSISLLAVGLVLFITLGVAWWTNWIWGFPFALGALLGAIISPPDAIAATAIIQRLRVKPQLAVILEGESLVNDATALAIYNLALVALFSHHFSLVKGVGLFFFICVGGILVGLALAALAVWVIRKVEDVVLAVATSLILPFVCYLVAVELQLSGVLAAVTAGLYVGKKMQHGMAALMRIEVMAFWRSIIFMLNGAAFILIGLQTPQIWEDLKMYSWQELVWYAFLINLLIAVLRFIWVMMTLQWPSHFSKRWKDIIGIKSWKESLLIGWCGMRGVVSLAAALAIPLTVESLPFPHRSLLVFLTFSVVVFSLLGQGLTLPWFIRRLGLGQKEAQVEEEVNLRLKTADIALKKIEQMVQKREITPEITEQLKEKYERKRHWANSILSKVRAVSRRKDVDWEMELLRTERESILQAKEAGEVNEEMARYLLNELDLEVAHLQERIDHFFAPFKMQKSSESE